MRTHPSDQAQPEAQAQARQAPLPNRLVQAIRLAVGGRLVEGFAPGERLSRRIDRYFWEGTRNNIFRPGPQEQAQVRRVLGVDYDVVARQPKPRDFPVARRRGWGPFAWWQLRLAYHLQEQADYHLYEVIGGVRTAGLGLAADGRLYLLTQFHDAPAIHDLLYWQPDLFSPEGFASQPLARITAAVVQSIDQMHEQALARGYVIGDAHGMNLKVVGQRAVLIDGWPLALKDLKQMVEEPFYRGLLGVSVALRRAVFDELVRAGDAADVEARPPYLRELAGITGLTFA